MVRHSVRAVCRRRCGAGVPAAAPTDRAPAIGIEAPAVSPDLVSGRTGLDRDERLRALSQQLRSPAVLERVAREERLVTDRPIDQVVQDLLDRIKVEVPPPIARTQSDPELDAFDIVYLDRTAERAQRVAEKLAQVFVEENTRSREVQAEGTTEFLSAQQRASQDRIADLEKRLRTAKEQHMGKLPEQTLANLQTLSGVRTQLESTSNNLRSEQDRLTMLDRQLQQMKEGFYSAPQRRREARRRPRSSVSWPFSVSWISRGRSTPTSIRRSRPSKKN